jgi:hypothetical protein
LAKASVREDEQIFERKSVKKRRQDSCG